MPIPIIGAPKVSSKYPKVSSLKTPMLRRNYDRPGTEIFRAYTRQGIDGDDSRPRYNADQWLADRIYKILMRHFPDHLWRVEVSHKQGVATIRLMGFSDCPHILKIEDLKLLGADRDVMRAGGELLERFRMPTSGFKQAEFEAAKAKFRPHLTRRKHPNLIGAT